MVSQTVEYALRAAVSLASKHDRPCTTHQIALSTGVPNAYLSKIMQNMARTGILRSQRGRKGGFVLVRSPDKITIWDVVEAVEPFKRITECPIGIASHSGGLCPLHQRLDDSMAIVEKVFRQTTLSDLLCVPAGAPPLCTEEGDSAKETVVSISALQSQLRQD